MVAQYTAAALVAENRLRAFPASVESIPTSAGMEDHVSMGAHAARKAAMVLRNSQQVIAIELLSAAQAVDLGAGGLGIGTSVAYAAVREIAPRLEEDRVIATDFERALELVKGGVLTRRINDALTSVRPA